jgi:hypothetical protein
MRQNHESSANFFALKYVGAIGTLDRSKVQLSRHSVRASFDCLTICDSQIFLLEERLQTQSDRRSSPTASSRIASSHARPLQSFDGSSGLNEALTGYRAPQKALSAPRCRAAVIIGIGLRRNIPCFTARYWTKSNCLQVWATSLFAATEATCKQSSGH